jgi:Ca-activated chloride channel homolog
MHSFVKHLLMPLIVVLSISPSVAIAEQAPPAMIIIDGSGSMGGPLEGQTEVKFDLAKKAILDLLPQAASDARTGLVTFGNHRRQDCGDLETPITPAAGNLDQFKTVFSKIGPVGRGPLVYALQHALKSFPAGTPGTMIVLHDGIDNCRQDACAAAAEIAKTHPKLVIHSIPISLDKSVAERMACVAQQTGGKVFEARDGAAVMSGLKEALTLAGVLGRSDAIATPLPSLDPNGPPSLRLRASLSQGGPALTAPISWRVKSAAAPHAVIKEGNVPVLATELPEGDYTIEATYGLSRSETSIKVAAKGQTLADISLEAGILKVSSLTQKSAASALDPAIVVSSLSASNGTGTPLLVSRNISEELIVPAGRYRIEAGDGLAAKSEVVEVKAGATVVSDMAVNAGRLQVSALTHDGGAPIKAATFVISADDPDAANGRREITRSSAATPDFVLPAGTYYVTVKTGASEIRERVAISTGDVVKRTIVLNGAWIALTTIHDGSLVPNGAPVTFKVFPKDTPKDGQAVGIASERSETGGPPPAVFLPFGSYRIEATLGRQNVRGDLIADISATSPTALPVKMAVSEIVVRPPADAGAASGLYWELRDSRGKIVQRSAGSLADKVLLMAPGPYLLRSESGDKFKDLSLDLKPSERRVVAMPLN